MQSKRQYNREDQLTTLNVLLISESYPTPGDLYAGMFIHRRVKAYIGSGINIEVFRYKKNLDGMDFSFEDVNIKGVHTRSLENLLKEKTYDVILIHFLNKDIWDVIEKAEVRSRIIVWVHGYEIQAWWRRIFNLQDVDHFERETVNSEKRMDFWRNLFKNLPDNIHFVFVSDFLRASSAEDIGIPIPTERTSIIHNFIDCEFFSYEPKDVEQRKKILSIRSFSSHNYANDLTVKTILDLAKKPFFDELEFRIIGDGKLFEDTVKPIMGMRNVHLERRFLDMNELKSVMREYGVFLIPTRLDSQGVSRDEAMACGLVPMTNNVAAIPEFVNPKCGIIAPQEDHEAFVAGIEMLMQKPQLFLELSRAASQKVNRTSDFSHTIKQEILLIKGLSDRKPVQSSLFIR